MRKLVVNKKTGLRIKDVYKPVIIRDDRMIIFYSTESMLPDCNVFNLPKGTYFVESGNFESLPSPIPFTLIKLPTGNRFFYPNAGNFPIKIVKNPNKCSIDWERKVILLDESFREKSWPIIDFILSHEIGHKYYGDKPDSEINADLFAANRMIKKGYNPSQIAYAQLDSLSGRQLERKNVLTQKIINSYERTRSRM
jgi:hypothetical protein